MTEHKIIEYNLDFYIIDKDVYEPDEIFYERKNYILNNLKKDTFNNLVKNSRLLSNKKNYNCQYSDKIMQNL